GPTEGTAGRKAGPGRCPTVARPWRSEFQKGSACGAPEGSIREARERASPRPRRGCGFYKQPTRFPEEPQNKTA
ncbi:MAG: hypothetical protein AB7G48_18840, partial [Nitrospiraceae bacterium]